MRLPSTLDPNGPLDSTIGPLYLGVVISAMLYGLCLLQAFLYFQKYKQDSWYIKIAVITLILFDAIHLSMITAGVYHYVIKNYHDNEVLLRLHWLLSVEAMFVGMNGAIVQLFYIYRIWLLSKRNWLLCSVIIVFVLTELGTALAWVIISTKMKTFENLLTITPLAITVHASASSADVVIAGSLCVLLHRARTGFKQTDSVINKLILFVVNTGLLTTVFAVSAFTSLLISRLSLIYGFFYFCLGRLYTNSFLATLNARKATAIYLNEVELNMNSFSAQGSSMSR